MPSPKSKFRSAKGNRFSNRAEEFERLLTKAPLGKYVLRLFVTGTTPRSAQAVANIRAICDEKLAGRYDLEVIDIYQQPTRARREQIIALPTLLKKLPAPARRMVGDFSNRGRLLLALGIQYLDPSPKQLVRTKWLKI